MKRMALAALAGFLATTTHLYAADIPADAPIRSVVVYPQGASVTRAVPFTVPEGVSTLVIGAVPNGIDTGSIRVGGVAEAGLEIRSVETQSEALKTGDMAAEDPDRTRITDQIAALRDQQAELLNHLTALQAQQTFIQNLITQGPAGFADALGNGGGIDQWATAWQTIGQGLDTVLENIRQVQLQQRDLDGQIADLNTQLAALPVPPSGLEIRIEVAATAAGSGTVTVTYQTANASWRPAYDAMLDTGTETETPSIELVRRAEISQNTGEDWTDVNLTLSTTRPSGGTAAPEMGETIVQVYAPQPYYDAVPMPMAAAPAGREMGGYAGDTTVAVGEQQAVADFGDFHADFVIPDPVTVESGTASRSVRLSTDTADVDLSVQTTPRLAEQAFLTTDFTLDSEAPILAGSANLFRDGNYVGTGQLGFSNPGQEVHVGFGADDQVHVTFTLTDSNTGDRGLLTRVTDAERSYRITVENEHTRPIDITVLDRIPVSQDDRITVTQQPETTPPTETNVDDRRGVLGWTYTYEAGESRDIVNAYEVTYPADLDVTGLD